MKLKIHFAILLLFCIIGHEIKGMQKPQPSLAANIAPYIRQALDTKDTETINFYKQFRANDVAHYFDMEVTRFTNALFKNQLQNVLKQAAAVDYKLPIGKYISYVVRGSNDPEIVNILLPYADQSDAQFINKEIERLYKQASQSNSESEKKQLAEQIAAFVAYNLMIPQESAKQKPAAQTKAKAASLEDIAQEIKKRQSHPQHRLIAALQKEDLAAVKQALKDGANTRDEFGTGMSPLGWALTNYNREILMEMLKFGANPTDVLHFAISTGRNDLLKDLIAQGADITLAGMLEDAIDAENFEGAQILLQKGLPKNRTFLARSYLHKYFRTMRNDPRYLKWKEVFGIENPAVSEPAAQQEVPKPEVPPTTAKPKTEEELFKEFIQKAKTVKKPDDKRPNFDLITYFKLKVAPYATAYEILNVPTNASREVIKKAYAKRSIEWHPDRNKSPEATQVFQLIAWAYEKALEELEKKK